MLATPQQQQQYAAAMSQYQMQQQQQHQMQTPGLMPPRPQPQATVLIPQLEDLYLTGGHKNRIRLALESNLPNEVDWAFNKLLQVSYVCPDSAFSLEMVPQLLDALLDHAEPFMRLVNRLQKDAVALQQSVTSSVRTEQATLAALNDAQRLLFEPSVGLNAVDLERTLQLFTILRNFSFLSSSIVQFLTSPRLFNIIAVALDPRGSVHPQITSDAFDILEALAAHLIIEPENPLASYLKHHFLHSFDRANILAALRCMARLAVEQNEKLCLSWDDRFVRRGIELLTITIDDEMTTTLMDWWWRWSEVASKHIIDLGGSVLIKLLLKYLTWRGVSAATGANAVPVSGKHAGVSQGAGAGPSDQNVDARPMHDRQFVLQWWKDNLVMDPSHMQEAAPMYNLYRAHCQQRKFAAIGMTEWLSSVRAVFPQAVPGSTQPNVYVIKGVRHVPEEKHQVPLSAALVLRNMSRVLDYRHLYLPYESDVALAITLNGDTALTRVLCSLLEELARPIKKDE